MVKNTYMAGVQRQRNKNKADHGFLHCSRSLLLC